MSEDILGLIDYVRGSEEYLTHLAGEAEQDYYEQDRVMDQIDYAIEEFEDLIKEVA